MKALSAFSGPKRKSGPATAIAEPPEHPLREHQNRNDTYGICEAYRSSLLRIPDQADA